MIAIAYEEFSKIFTINGRRVVFFWSIRKAISVGCRVALLACRDEMKRSGADYNNNLFLTDYNGKIVWQSSEEEKRKFGENCPGNSFLDIVKVSNEVEARTWHGRVYILNENGIVRGTPGLKR